MAYPSPSLFQDDQEPLLNSWRSMTRINDTAVNSNGELPNIGKSEADVAGSGSVSTSASEAGVPKSGFRGKDTGAVTFATGGLGKDHYRPVETYEGIHRYDPDFEWDPEEEKKVVRKVSNLFYYFT